jgi:hypothetical protein
MVDEGQKESARREAEAARREEKSDRQFEILFKNLIANNANTVPEMVVAKPLMTKPVVEVAVGKGTAIA